MAPEPARGPARDSLFHLDQSRGDSIAARGLVDGQLAVFADNVAYLRAGAPAVYGRDAAKIVLDVAKENNASSISWEPLGGGVSYDLLAGYTYGVAARDNGARPPHIERYIAYWERSRGQPWRIAAYAEIGAPAVTVPDASLSAAMLVPRERPVPKLATDARNALRIADSLFSDLSYRMGTGYAFSNTVAGDGVVFGFPELLVGPKAILDSYERTGASTSLTWRPVYASVAGSRDLGFTIGESISTGRGPSGAAVQRVGKYLTIWRRDGSVWRFVVDGGNAAPAPAHP